MCEDSCLTWIRLDADGNGQDRASVAKRPVSSHFSNLDESPKSGATLSGLTNPALRQPSTCPGPAGPGINSFLKSINHNPICKALQPGKCLHRANPHPGPR